MFAPLLILLPVAAATAPSPSAHAAALAKAEAAVAAAAPRAAADPLRPIFHVLPAAQWMNDPNGPVFFDGHYHLFFQLNPYGDKWEHMHWGHVRSPDLVRWEALPIALAPSLEAGEKHCFSGCAVVDARGKLRLLYTSIGDRDPEQWAAIATDPHATRFDKLGPVVTTATHAPDVIEEWRDPFVFREAGRWYMVTGGRRKGSKGGVFLYDSTDLERWRYRGSPLTGKEDDWECPLLVPLDPRHHRWALVYSPFGHVRVITGRLDVATARFTPEREGDVTRGDFYAPNVMQDPRGRWIMFGWIRGFPEGRGWNGAQTLPTVLSLDADGRLVRLPAPELERLRARTLVDERAARPVGADAVVIERANRDAMELGLKLELADARRIVTTVRRSADGKRGLAIAFDGRTLDVDGGRVKLELPKPASALELRVFVDRSVVEVFTGDGLVSVARVAAGPAEDTGVAVAAEGGSGRLSAVRVWEMATIW